MTPFPGAAAINGRSTLFSMISLQSLYLSLAQTRYIAEPHPTSLDPPLFFPNAVSRTERCSVGHLLARSSSSNIQHAAFMAPLEAYTRCRGRRQSSPTAVPLLNIAAAFRSLSSVIGWSAISSMSHSRRPIANTASTALIISSEPSSLVACHVSLHSSQPSFAATCGVLSPR